MIQCNWLTTSILMGLKMCRQLVQYCVPFCLVQCVFMMTSMFCISSSQISPNSNQFRLVFFLFYCCIFSNSFSCRHLCWSVTGFTNFGSSASQCIYAQFMVQASAFNNGKKIGLLQGTGTSFATWFYSMHRLLWHKAALKATIYNPTLII